ncbi:DUF1772 domain-containing protein [Streptomyces sp. NPDC058221]|uniref:anthrone oxygenase family protein n=1 Tax=Streptomyces sp. NPDC058221 TaxID=3346388 RepID=UPI0036E62320
MASLILDLAVITTGLYAGFMLTFLIAVMPGLSALPDVQFTAAMRRINETVPRPVFLILFLGAIVFPAIAVFTENGEKWWGLVAVALACAVVSHLVTICGNIPLNKALAEAEAEAEGESEAGSGAGAEGEGEGDRGGDSAARTAFEARWNAFHRFRTVLSLIAFVLLAFAAH